MYKKEEKNRFMCLGVCVCACVCVLSPAVCEMAKLCFLFTPHLVDDLRRWAGGPPYTYAIHYVYVIFYRLLLGTDIIPARIPRFLSRFQSI